ncbi:VapA/VapB family virulence-associated protein [Xenorhabdus griffiniae]|uniref:VapA/VapB family virulence-associated protein n=1 Tax=Xenorhabdus griffiniae TaxID=351672 RepID=A0ABY9XJ70_9GAMM|nr:VapA/VapB family virulence-associated protein [Xenorhabdus griffiniae]MBD1226769.1 VapA/VapB family virulence-associated protein [Xenorhabdus griffiniae]MBE8587630.1 VapA/VapB family virulence-associated protein [Xenorhabdus griffiniae]WMV72973.1 VapA/VapB family virulence-associated protein [Xenorhabdus griffiniae]WNH02652.1 VapA/VapB family virulence-associated protein [Xenorhabdus griffiniae]
MNKLESSLFSEKGLKFIDSLESLSKESANMLKNKTTNDSIVKPSESSTHIYKAFLELTSYVFYYQFTLSLDGGKTFYGKAGGLGSPGKGEFSGEFIFGVDDINIIYQNATGFIAVVTPITINIGFADSSLDKLAQFNGSGLGTISATITGGGYWK